MSADFKTKVAEKKPPVGVIPLSALLGAARVFQYGAAKYAPGNFHLATVADGAGPRYVSAGLRHAMAMQNPDGTYDAASLAAADEESGLPHIDHWICGLVMLRAILVKEGVMPADPGQGNPPPSAAG